MKFLIKLFLLALAFCGASSAQWSYSGNFSANFRISHQFSVSTEGMEGKSYQIWYKVNDGGWIQGRTGGFFGNVTISVSGSSEAQQVNFRNLPIGHEESVSLSGNTQFLLVDSVSRNFGSGLTLADSGVLEFNKDGTGVKVSTGGVSTVSTGETSVTLNFDGTVNVDGDISIEDTDSQEEDSQISLVEGLALLISWPLKEALDLGNGIVIPANEGGSPWQYIPIDALSSDFLAEAFPLGHMATASDGSPLFVAAFGADGNLSVEREVTDFDARFNDITGNLHVSALVDGFVDSVTVNGGSGDNGRQVTDSVAGAASTSGGSTGGDTAGTVSVGITATPTTPAEPDTEDPVVGGSGGSGDGGGGGSLTNITVNSPTTNNNSSTTNTFNINNFESQDGLTEADAFADAAGFDYGDDDGSDIAEELASSLTDNVRSANDGAKGVLGFLNISTLDPGISPISLSFTIPKTDARFDWAMDSKLASFLRKIMNLVLVSAFWAGVTRKLMM